MSSVTTKYFIVTRTFIQILKKIEAITIEISQDLPEMVLYFLETIWRNAGGFVDESTLLS